MRDGKSFFTLQVENSSSVFLSTHLCEADPVV